MFEEIELIPACKDSGIRLPRSSEGNGRAFALILTTGRGSRIIQKTAAGIDFKIMARLKGSRFYSFPMALKISSCSGNLPVSFLEKIFLPSTTTSKTPPSDFINSGLIPNLPSIASARPTALGP